MLEGHKDGHNAEGTSRREARFNPDKSAQEELWWGFEWPGMKRELWAVEGAGLCPAREDRSELSLGLCPAGQVVSSTPRMGPGTWAAEPGLRSGCPPLSCILLLTHSLFKTPVISNLALGRNLSILFSVLLKTTAKLVFSRPPPYIYLSQGATISDVISWWVPLDGDHSFHGGCDGSP